MKSYDSVVVGGGPAGMTAALYLLRSGANMAWVEKLSPGGQVLNTEFIENYPGFPKGVRGYELSDLFAAHLDEFPCDKYMDAVRSIKSENGKHVLQVGDEFIETKTVLICTGSKYRKLELNKEEDLTGRGISYCALCDGNFFRDQVVGVVGGGDTALEESLYLTKLVKKVYLIHRRDAFRASKIYQDKVLENSKIEVVYDSVIKSILGDDQLAGVEIENRKTGDVSTLDLDGLFVFIGYQAAKDFFPEGLDLDTQGFIKTDAEMQTNIPGIFAAGDIRSKRCRQVTTAVGDGATAANSAFLYLEQNQ